MKIFPHKEFEIQSTHTKEQLTDRLQANVLEGRDFWDKPSDEHPQFFKGEVYLDGFNFIPRGWKHGRRTERPRISGTIIEDDGGAVIKGEMKFNAFLKWLLIIMLIFFAAVAILLPDRAVIIIPGVIIIDVINLIYFHARFNASAEKCLAQLEIIAGEAAEADDEMQRMNK